MGAIDAMVPLASVTLTSGQSTVSFSSLSQSYKDLRLVICPQNYTASAWIGIRFNSDSAANYSRVGIRGNGSTATSYSVASETAAFVDSPSANEVIQVNVMGYSDTDKHKVLLNRADSVADNAGGTVGRWASTAAITSITITTTSAETYGAGSTFNLFGIRG